MTNTLYVKGYGLETYDAANSRMAALIFYSTPNIYNSMPSSPLVIEYGTQDPFATPYAIFPDINTAIDYYGAAQAAALISSYNTSIGTTFYTAYDLEKVDPPVHVALQSIDYNSLSNKPTLFSGVYTDLTGKPSLATVASSGAYSDLSGKPSLSTVATSGVYADLTGKPSLASVATSGDYNDLSNKPVINTPSYSTPVRSINTAFQISTTRDSNVVYSIPVTSAATLLLGSQVSATFQYADNSTMTTNLVTLPGDVFGIASGLVVSGVGSLKLVGRIPAGKYVKITTTNIAGTPTLGSIVAQEVLL